MHASSVGILEQLIKYFVELSGPNILENNIKLFHSSYQMENLIDWK